MNSIDAPEPALFGSSPQLLKELIAQFEALVGLQVPDLRSHLRPGLSTQECDQRLGKLGLQAPAELTVLYGWADGLVGDLPCVLPNFPLSRLESAIEWYKLDRGVDADNSDMGTGEGWLRIVDDVRGCTVSCQGEEPPRIRYVNERFSLDVDLYRATSLCTLVSWWIDGLTAGAYEYTPHSGWTVVDHDALPREQVAHGWV